MNGQSAWLWIAALENIVSDHLCLRAMGWLGWWGCLLGARHRSWPIAVHSAALRGPQHGQHHNRRLLPAATATRERGPARPAVASIGPIASYTRNPARSPRPRLSSSARSSRSWARHSAIASAVGSASTCPSGAAAAHGAEIRCGQRAQRPNGRWHATHRWPPRLRVGTWRGAAPPAPAWPPARAAACTACSAAAPSGTGCW